MSLTYHYLGFFLHKSFYINTAKLCLITHSLNVSYSLSFYCTRSWVASYLFISIHLFTDWVTCLGIYLLFCAFMVKNAKTRRRRSPAELRAVKATVQSLQSHWSWNNQDPLFSKNAPNHILPRAPYSATPHRTTTLNTVEVEKSCSHVPERPPLIWTWRYWESLGRIERRSEAGTERTCRLKPLRRDFSNKPGTRSTRKPRQNQRG